MHAFSKPGRRCAAGVVTGLLGVVALATDPAAHWPSFRGPAASGVAAGRATPGTWNVETGDNVRWKTPLAGLGLSSLAIWGDRLFTTTAVGGDEKDELKTGLYGSIQPVEDSRPHSFRVLCLDRNTGKVLWDQEAVSAVPKIKRHPKASHANCTPATDGKHVVAFFGSEGLYCYDVDGKLLWKRDLGVLDSGYYVVPGAQWGFGSSPVIYGDKVLLQCDVQKDSFVAALRLTDGSDIWRTPREEVPTWSTPAVVEGAGGRKIVVVNGYKHIGGYDLETGKEVWKLTGGGDIPVPTPISAFDLVFITNAHGAMAPMYAIRASAQGEISLPDAESKHEHVAWWSSRRGNYMQTPIVVGPLLFGCMDNGILTCFDAKTGETRFRQRLGTGRTGFTASPVAGGNLVYFTSEEGDVHVLKAQDSYEQVATNVLGEQCMATPAIADGTLYFRTRGHVIAIAEGARLARE